MLFYYISEISEQCAGLDGFNRKVQGLSRALHQLDRVWVCQRFLAHVIRLVQIAVESAVVEGYVDIYDISIF